jgi:uncharacterized protein YraI
MLRLLLFLMLCGGFIGEARAADCSRSYTASTHFTTTELRLRSYASPRASIVTTLPRGQRVEISRQDGDWVQVRVPALNLRGAVAARYLSETCVEGAELTRRTMARADVVNLILTQSRSGYSGSCACPNDRDRAGRRCGGRSAYSRPGGASPLCYASDVTEARIARFRSG